MKQARISLLICVFVLMSLGMVMLYSATMRAGYLTKQLIGFGLGLGLCGMLTWIDYREWRRFSPYLVGVAVLMLGLVLIPKIGMSAGGARRWFHLFGFSFQPSEFAKVALIIALAHYGERYQRFMGEFWRGLVVPGCILVLPLGLIFVEPDRGTTILLATVSLSLLLLAGARWVYLMPPALVGMAGLGFILWQDPLRLKRILSWLDVEGTKNDVGYQAYQAMLALGSGGVWGRGLGNSRQKLGFLPEHHTDFLFPIIGEELGLMGTLGIILAFILLIWCGFRVARYASDMFGFLLASGLTLLVGLQAVINIGVVTSALPNKGLPLPFIGYGGSNLMLMLGCIGLLCSISYHSTPNSSCLSSERSDGIEGEGNQKGNRKGAANPFAAPGIKRVEV